MKYLIILFLFISFHAAAQDKSADLDLIEEHHFHSEFDSWYRFEGNSDSIMQLKSNRFFAKYNPVSLLLKGAMAAYQRALSPLIFGSCVYELSCSNFCKHAIREFGLIKGLALSVDRITRCNRISVLDLHPANLNPATGKYVDVPGDYKKKG